MAAGDFKGPLAGVKILDFGHYYAGPMAGMLLADQGADVIHIVRPGKSEIPEHQYRVLNRNKKILIIDLKTEEGKRQALSLISRADVVIENFRPGVMKRLGLDYLTVKDSNPSLIYLSLPGFASTDRERAHIQAWEGVLAAAMGIFVNYSMIRRPLGYPPLYTPLAHCSAYGACHGVVAVMAALLAREEHGYGTVVEVPLVDAGLSGCTTSFTTRTYTPRSNRSVAKAFEPFKYAKEDSERERDEKTGRAWNVALPAIYKVYDTADRRKFQCWGFYNPNPEYAEAIHQAMGIYTQLIEEGFQYLGPWKTDVDCNVNAPQMLSANRDRRLEQLMADAFLTKTADEWEKLLGQYVNSQIRTRAEFLSLEPMLQSGVLTKMDDNNSVLTAPGRLSDITGPNGMLMEGFDEPISIDYESATELFGNCLSKKQLSTRSAQDKGELLQGLKVLDLANVMAVPMAGYILAQYGAEVITSVDPIKSIFPENICHILEASMGKRSMILDLTTAPGREVLERLISRSDVVLHNILDDKALRLGVTHEQVQATNPQTITCQASAWGGSLKGHWECRTGVDMTVLAETGIQARFGSSKWPQYFGQGSVVDSITALAAAYTALLGVWQQRTLGYAGEARTSLVRGNSFFQLPWMIDVDGNSEWGDPGGQSALGNSWYQRLYECHDGWVYVEVPPANKHLLTEVVLGKISSNAKEPSQEKRLEAEFLKHTQSYWFNTLNNADIACHSVLSVEDLCLNPRTVDNKEADEQALGALEFLRWEKHPSGLPVILPAPAWVRIGEKQSYKRCKPSPRRGEHTREILNELGYDGDQIDRLIRVKVAHEYLPPLGNKDTYFFEAKG